MLALWGLGAFGLGGWSVAHGADEPRWPRFFSLKADTVNMRVGPGRHYPIEWVYTRRGLPVEVVAAFDKWRQIRDPEGERGWVHQSLLSPRRTVLILADEQIVRRLPRADAAAVARAEPGVIAALVACENGWCEISAGEIQGWVPRRALWGIGAAEGR